MNGPTITTIIVAVALAKCRSTSTNAQLVDILSAFRACLKADHKRVPVSDEDLVELAEAIRSDFGYIVEDRGA
jgi:hypothetical protein